MEHPVAPDQRVCSEYAPVKTPARHAWLLTLGLAGTAPASFEVITAGDGSTIEGDVTALGTVEAGGSVGTANITGAFTMAEGSEYDWEVNNAEGGDLIAVDGDLDLSSDWTLDINIDGYVSSGQYALFTYTGDLTGPALAPVAGPGTITVSSTAPVSLLNLTSRSLKEAQTSPAATMHSP